MPTTLKNIVAIKHKDPWQARIRFIQALTEWAWDVEGRRTIPIEDWPDTARMIWTLSAIHSEMCSSGLFYLIDRQTGDHIAYGKKWLKKIGANKSVAYLDGFAALFPRKRIPETVEERMEVTERLYPEAKLDAVLNPLDNKYREVVINEIPDKLRKYVAANLKAFEKGAAHAAKSGRGLSPDDVILFQPDQKHPFAWKMEYPRYANTKKVIDSLEPVPDPGMVFEVFARKKYAYVQVTHRHFYDRVVGPIVRVFDGLHKKALTPEEIRDIVKGPELYFTTFDTPFQRALIAELKDDRSAIREVGRFPLPASAEPFPVFLFTVGQTRDERNVWDLWKGDEFPSSRAISPLREDLKTLPYAPISLTADELIGQIADGWRPIDAHRFWGDL